MNCGMSKKITVELSLKNATIIFGSILTIFLLWQLQEIVFMVFLAFIINSSLRPFIDKLEEKKIPRVFSIIIIYALIVLIMIIGGMTVVSQIVSQFTTLLTQVPEIIANLGDLLSNILVNLSDTINKFPGINSSISTNAIQEELKIYIENFDLGSVSGGVSHAVKLLNSTFGALMKGLTVLILSVYMLAKKEDVYTSLVMLLPKAQAKKYSSLIKKIEDNLGRWLRGQLSLMLIIGILTWVGLTIPSLFIDNYNLHKFALLFAVLSALLEIVPTLGPVIATVISIVLAAGFNSSEPLLPVLYIGVLYTFIQQVETAYLVPKIMQKAVGLDPVLTITAIYAALNIFDLLGVVLIVPMLAVLSILIKYEINEGGIFSRNKKTLKLK